MIQEKAAALVVSRVFYRPGRLAIAAALVAGCLLSACPAQAMGGPFYQNLYNTFCRNKDNYYVKAGCSGYLQYRIMHGYTREKAFSNCLWGCGKAFSNPQEI